MININKIETNNLINTNISIIGGGKSGIASAKLAKHLGAKVFISESNNS